jgi:membrane dipeptidase
MAPQTFQLALNAREVTDAMRRGKIAALLGLEGCVSSVFRISLFSPENRAHHLGNSLSTLRQFAALGVRYLTLTHFCHNVFADSCGILEMPKPLHNGLRCDPTFSISLFSRPYQGAKLTAIARSAKRSSRNSIVLVSSSTSHTHRTLLRSPRSNSRAHL